LFQINGRYWGSNHRSYSTFHLLNASSQLLYYTILWKFSKIIFIIMPGKILFTQTSYRPITIHTLFFTKYFLTLGLGYVFNKVVQVYFTK
ncbi:Reverse transcriptase domain-containing protein, partial [Aphis craccivora]